MDIQTFRDTEYLEAFAPLIEGGRKTLPIGVACVKESKKIFFYPTDYELMLKNGIDGAKDLANKWLSYRKFLNGEPLMHSERENFYIAEAYFNDYLQKYLGGSKIQGDQNMRFMSNKWEKMYLDLKITGEKSENKTIREFVQTKFNLPQTASSDMIY